MLNSWKEIYSHSSDNLTDTIRRYSYSEYWDTYLQDGAEIRNYYPNGLKKTVTIWLSGYHDFYYNEYSSPNEDNEYKYTESGNIDEITSFAFINGKRSPFSISKYFYDKENRLDSIVRKDLNNNNMDWVLYYKEIYSYSDRKYEILTLHWIYELNSLVEVFKTEFLLSSGRVDKEIHYMKNKQEWEYSFHLDYEYTKDGYSVINVEKSGNYSKREYRSDEHNNLIYESLFYWDRNLEYWYLYDERKYTYYYSHAISNEKVLKEQFKVYSYGNTVQIETTSPQWYSIYSLNGILMKKVFVDCISTVNLPEGFYIITDSRSSQKIIVR